MRSLNRSLFADLCKLARWVIAPGIVTIATAAFAQAPGGIADAPNPAEWTRFGNGPGQLFYSPLDQINEKSVSKLGIAWSVDLPSKDGPYGNILVADGTAYESVSGGRVYAVDTKAHKLLWKFEPEFHFQGASLGTFMGARMQRGVALDGTRLFITLPDCRTVALDRVTGMKSWEKQTCDSGAGYTQTGPAQVGRNLVFIGNVCVDMGGRRGFITALDQQTGEEKWRFYVVPRYPDAPAGGQESAALDMAARTWGTNPPQQQVGCGGSYGGMTYDPVTNLLFVSTSGAAPISPSARAKDAGDELFTGSILALNADTGEYVWHYKLAAHDGWNWEPFQSIVTDVTVHGTKRRVLMNAPKHGFLITLDARTGKFIAGAKIADVNWASGFDVDGRPILTGEANYWEKGAEGAIAAGAAIGAHSTAPMSYNPKTNLVYVSTGNIFTLMTQREDVALGNVTWDPLPEGHPRSGQLLAIDPVSKKIHWQVKQEMPFNGGVLSTGGNLVFEGTATGYLEVRAADTGKLLWSKYMGWALPGSISTVMLDGEQYILVPSGNATSSGAGTSAAPLASCPDCRNAPARIVAFKLGGKVVLPPNPKRPVPKPPLPRFTAAIEKQGKNLYASYSCEVCHGLNMVNGGGTAPDLHRTDAARHRVFADIVRGGLLNPAGMPRFPGLTDDDLKALQAYIINGAWDAYDAQGLQVTGSRK